MSGWARGAAEIEALLLKRHLERVSGARADGRPWLSPTRCVPSSPGPFATLNSLRRRRNELEYPSFPGEQVDAAEVVVTITAVRDQLDAGTKLIEHLGSF